MIEHQQIREKEKNAGEGQEMCQPKKQDSHVELLGTLYDIELT